jgi:hypothetical protein
MANKSELPNIKSTYVVLEKAFNRTPDSSG